MSGPNTKLYEQLQSDGYDLEGVKDTATWAYTPSTQFKPIFYTCPFADPAPNGGYDAPNDYRPQNAPSKDFTGIIKLFLINISDLPDGTKAKKLIANYLLKYTDKETFSEICQAMKEELDVDIVGCLMDEGDCQWSEVTKAQQGGYDFQRAFAENAAGFSKMIGSTLRKFGSPYTKAFQLSGHMFDAETGAEDAFF